MGRYKYHIIYNTVKEKIIAGEYSAGYRLPSKRIMADKSGCSIITVERAYSMLEDEGYIFAEKRKGYFVSDIDIIAPSEPTCPQVKFNYLSEASDDSDHDFEYSIWFRTIRKVISDNGNRLFAKSPGAGCAVLRNAIADYLYRYRGMFAQPERIIIGSGAEQLYEEIVKILGRDRIYGIEDPCYDQIPAVYKGIGTEVCRLKMSENGIDSSELYNRKFDVLHVTPFNSYPSGVTAPVSKRYEYLKWAESTGNYIIEDDFDSEFFMPGHPIESLYSLDSIQSVIYVNTFSKSLSPSMRIGYMILPVSLLSVYESLLGKFSCSVPVLDQYVLAEFISSGNFERHLNRVRRKINKSLK